MMPTVLKTEHLNKVYRLGSLLRRIKINALNDVNLEVKSNEPEHYLKKKYRKKQVFMDSWMII